jgi:hypothetical protein
MYSIWTRKPAGSALITICLLILTLGNVNAGDDRNSLIRIDDAFRAGEIDRSEMLVEKIKALFAPQDLASEFKSDSPSFIKSGTGLIGEVHDRWDEFSPEQQSLLTSYLGRPSKAFSYDSPGGFFKIHYDTIAPEAVPREDIDGDSIPDYVERIAEYSDSAYQAYMSMGYLPPPADAGSGGDDKYDIYLVAGNFYGATLYDGDGDSVWNDARSYIWVHYSFLVQWLYENDDPQGDTIGAQKVTCAHEVHHAVQLAYVFDYNEFLWIMEATATWMEEVIYPEVNDNYNYLDNFFDYPERGLRSTDGYHQYGSFIWPAFMQQKFDYTVIRRLWEASRYNLSLDANDSALAYYGTDLLNIFPEFAIWNYFTADRAIPGMYYSDAADYLQVKLDQSFITLENDSIQPISPPDGLACNYVHFDVDTAAHGILEIFLDGSNLVRWADVGVFSDDGDDIVITQMSDGMDPVSIYLPFIEDYSGVKAVPSVVSRYLTENDYSLTNRIIPYGDANYDFEANVGDASYLISYVFLGGAEPQPILETGDANCDGSVNVADAVTTINYVFNSGDEPCANRLPQ